MKVSWCLEERYGNVFFFFFLRQNKVNLRTWTYIIYKSAAPANIKSEAFGTALLKSAFCGKQTCLSCRLWQHLRPLPHPHLPPPHLLPVRYMLLLVNHLKTVHYKLPRPSVDAINACSTSSTKEDNIHFNKHSYLNRTHQIFINHLMNLSNV